MKTKNRFCQNETDFWKCFSIVHFYSYHNEQTNKQKVGNNKKNPLKQMLTK